MPKIKEIIGMDNHGDYALVHVLTTQGDTAIVYVGGDCEIYFHKNTIKAFIKRDKDLTK